MGVEPLDVAPTLPSTDQVTEEGYVYGQAPKPPRGPPDVEGMMQAVGLPGPVEGGLPFTLEWYAGAKERQAAREAEQELLLARKEELRGSWTELAWTDLAGWGAKVDTIAAEDNPLMGLAELLARAAHETPHEVDRIERLREQYSSALIEKDRLQGELATARRHLQRNEDAIRTKDLEDAALEEERLEQKRVADLRKARAERALRRNEAMLRGEAFEEEDEDDVDGGISQAEESAEEAYPPDVPARAGSRDETWLTGQHGPSSTGLPPGARGGLARELPPLPDPPPPPPLGGEVAHVKPMRSSQSLGALGSGPL